MAALSNYLETLLHNWHLTAGAATRPTSWFLGLATASADTGLTGEPSGNGYARQSITFSVTNDVATNTNLLTFGPNTGSNWGAMSHFGIFDASTSGNLLWHGALNAPKTVEVGDSLTVAIGDIDLTLA
jgi:hypothetical protein